jgi:hypothetical protein
MKAVRGARTDGKALCIGVEGDDGLRPLRERCSARSSSASEIKDHLTRERSTVIFDFGHSLPLEPSITPAL